MSVTLIFPEQHPTPHQQKTTAPDLPPLNQEEWLRRALAILLQARRSLLELGDLVNYAREVWGQTYEEIAAKLGSRPGTVIQWAWLARQFTPDLRPEFSFLPYSHIKEAFSQGLPLEAVVGLLREVNDQHGQAIIAANDDDPLAAKPPVTSAEVRRRAQALKAGYAQPQTVSARLEVYANKEIPFHYCSLRDYLESPFGQRDMGVPAEVEAVRVVAKVYYILGNP